MSSASANGDPNKIHKSPQPFTCVLAKTKTSDQACWNLPTHKSRHTYTCQHTPTLIFKECFSRIYSHHNCPIASPLYVFPCQGKHIQLGMLDNQFVQYNPNKVSQSQPSLAQKSCSEISLRCKSSSHYISTSCPVGVPHSATADLLSANSQQYVQLQVVLCCGPVAVYPTVLSPSPADLPYTDPGLRRPARNEDACTDRAVSGHNERMSRSQNAWNQNVIPK